MIVIAPTSYKGTIAAGAAARAMAAGARAVTSEAVFVQAMSDGGPGLIDALTGPDTTLQEAIVRGPLGYDVAARILVRNSTAILESADACGLHLVPADRRDPTQLDTYGVGQLIHAASSLPVERIVVGLGGSATVDGGIGMAEALEGVVIRQPVTALADVDTMLRDAARVFGPQKGATGEQVPMLEATLLRLQELATVPDFPGAGAAGGLGYGLRVFLNAEVLPGSAWVLTETGVEERLRTARALITGEGSYDAQSFMGKITGTLVGIAARYNVPALVIAGQTDGESGDARVVTKGGALLTEADLEALVREHLPALLHS